MGLCPPGHYIASRHGSRVHSAGLSRVWSDRLSSLGWRQEVRCPREPSVTAATQGLPMSFLVGRAVPLFGALSSLR